MGEPVLNALALPVDLEKEYEEIKQLTSDMITTLDHGGEKTGLAAPQVFVSKRVVIFRISKQSKSIYESVVGEEIPLTIMINPSIIPVSDIIVDGYESCLSVPGLMGIVPRYSDIEYTYSDLEGKTHCVRASGFHSRVIQHECDHLDGLLYPKRIKDLSNFGFSDVMSGIVP
jgi:peptide deformylase